MRSAAKFRKKERFKKNCFGLDIAEQRLVRNHEDSCRYIFVLC